MVATSAGKKIILEMTDKTKVYRLERKTAGGGEWLVFTAQGFTENTEGITPAPAQDAFVDAPLQNGLYQYRSRVFDQPDSEYDYSLVVRCGETDPVGYTFGNYHAPEGQWGEIQTPDDIRYSWLWGVDFKASNGESFNDEQIKFFIDAALARIERELNITIKKTRIASEPEKRGLKKGADYDEAESYYTYSRSRVQRNGMIPLRKRPVLSVSRLDLVNRTSGLISLLNASTIDKTKGMVKFFNRLPRLDDSLRAVQTAVNPYGADAFERNLFYAVDYVAGYESSDDVPIDLREVIGKIAAVSLLNNIGRGLMSGFSSSSLSMDGVSESFSSTQSATSAYYGADIKEYKDDIEHYISANKMKFGHVVLGCL